MYRRGIYMTEGQLLAYFKAANVPAPRAITWLRPGRVLGAKSGECCWIYSLEDVQQVLIRFGVKEAPSPIPFLSRLQKWRHAGQLRSMGYLPDGSEAESG
jgi:hypothetical protein